MHSPNDDETPATSVLRILVVENHADTLKYLALHLKASGHEVSTARSKAEALSQLARQTPDVLLSDIGLQDGDGWELLREAALPKSVFCVAMSGFGLTSDGEKSLAAGYRHHLRKPFLPRELDALLLQADAEAVARHA